MNGVQSCCVDGSQSRNLSFFFLLVVLFPWDRRRETEWIIGFRLFIKDLNILHISPFPSLFWHSFFLSLPSFPQPSSHFTVFLFHQAEHRHALWYFPTELPSLFSDSTLLTAYFKCINRHTVYLLCVVSMRESIMHTVPLCTLFRLESLNVSVLVLSSQ